MMTGQDTSKMPATIKNDVEAMKNDPTVKQRVDEYKAHMTLQASQEKARREAEAQAAKTAASQPAPAATPAPAPTQMTRVQDSSASTANVLNTQLATLIRASLETAEHTKKTASILASNGNALRR
jgi:3-oxoacyl-ACP reductase-like protein